MKKRTAAFLAFLTAATAFSAACGGTAPAQTTAAAQTTEAPAETTPAAETTTTTAQQTEAAPEQETEEMTPEKIREKIVKNSFFDIGSPERFAKALAKAENGEEITVAYIGGSITEGYTVQPEECWAYLTHRWLCEQFPDAKINYVNAGLSGTPSTLGLIRSDRDVIAPYGEPDIVFIEFAVNDANDSVNKEAYESLVRKMLTLESNPAVALIFMRTDNGYSCQDWQKEVGYLYHLPMISVNDALTNAIDNGYMTWADYSNDGAHPNPEGCKLIAEMIENMFDEFRGNGDRLLDVDANDITPIFGSEYVNMHMLDSASLTPTSAGEYENTAALTAFPNAWTRKAGGNEGISFDMEFDDLFIVYHCNKNKHFGTADVYVDGEKQCEVKSFAEDGWSNPVPQLVMRGDGVKQHKVEIKLQGDGEKTYFGILAFGVTNEELTP
ncbi:MAG: SGNH/GDSL hydrolase family protein [Ruminiclostridium sp.]|nr:SGNH/GDSL hydrolase family protein [Ruminiclostridium sp.]